MIPKVAPDAAGLVNRASPVGVEASLRAVGRRMRRWRRWLNNQHKYGKDVVTLLGSNHDIDAPKLGEYIAASAPLHLADGWNYLSRAFDSLAKGDRGSAYHLAYYAELRGGMSLLATQGIGIFDRRHIALDSQVQPTELTGTGTHRATWKVLEAWSVEADSARRILEAITLYSRNLSEWLGQIGVVSNSQGVLARDWLEAWSVDLKLFDVDRDRRNETSYRPSRIRIQDVAPVDPVLEVVQPLFGSWDQLEPLTPGAMAALDVSLLRQAIAHAINKGLCNYHSLDDAVAALQPIIPSTLHTALTNPSPSAQTIFRQAAVHQDSIRTVTPILARALLMLRFAAAHTAMLLEEAEISKDDLKFWWSSLGKDLGHWETVDEIESLSDLWIEVAEARDEVDADIAALPEGAPVRVVTDIVGRNVPLTQFSRAQMWLLGLD